MQVEIKQSQVNQDGLWWVVATLPSGLAHDSFQTKEAALDFALCFYGVDLGPKPKMAPKTTHAKTVEYNTTSTSCNCPDRSIRGGSYTLPTGERVCKHIKHYRDSLQAVAMTLRMVGV